ncbi:MAG TPA: zinc-binding dehydrogenase [Aliidongia sp.]|uniref:zinc-binding dehydrogenase n=1 Tax=Aliidongia sp. TaxID=1914230 RepID=UPI002DDD11EA|nr:zinc-binding dehydrogenase [Aliidongia sp.]HEV2677124.1 zinc-binding dehydrogenase [Aliidongia sp.]
MKAWRLHGAGGEFAFEDRVVPTPGPGGAVVRIEAAPVLSYMRKVLDGSLGYALPAGTFTPGTNGVGVVEAVGPGVYHLQPGQRVALSPHHLVDERVAAPAQLLIGLTAMGSARFGALDAATLALQADWPDGSFATHAHLPAATMTPLDGLDAVSPEQLAGLGKFIVPYGGFLRGGLVAGEVAIVNGATGFYGAAGVLVALAMGAARVVAAGRDATQLDALAAAGGDRVVTVGLSGDVEQDAAALRDAADGSGAVALDMVGRATGAESTLASLKALGRGGRLVLMGSMTVPLPVPVGEMLGNNWSILGNFMYPKDAMARLAALVRAGLLDLGALNVERFTLADLEGAMTAAAAMRGLDLTVVTP